MAHKQGYKRREVTPYYRNLLIVIVQLGTAGTRNIAQDDLAMMTGVKVTTSFRRAIEQAELDGHITPYRFYGERGGLRKGYEIHPYNGQEAFSEDDYFNVGRGAE